MGRGIPSTPGEGSGEAAMHPPQNFFSILDFKMATFGCILGTIFTVKLFCLNAETSSRG